MPIQILKRDSLARTIQVRCLHCDQGIDLFLKHVERLEDGVRSTVICLRCRQRFDVPPDELVIDGRLQLARLGDARYTVTFAPSTGPSNGIPALLESEDALSAFLNGLAAPVDCQQQALADLRTNPIAVQTMSLSLHHLKRVQLIA
jgi:hypothetical protein